MADVSLIGFTILSFTPLSLTQVKRLPSFQCDVLCLVYAQSIYTMRQDSLEIR